MLTYAMLTYADVCYAVVCSVAQAKVSTFMRASIMCPASSPGHPRYALTDAGVC